MSKYTVSDVVPHIIVLAFVVHMGSQPLSNLFAVKECLLVIC